MSVSAEEYQELEGKKLHRSKTSSITKEREQEKLRVFFLYFCVVLTSKCSNSQNLSYQLRKHRSFHLQASERKIGKLGHEERF